MKKTLLSLLLVSSCSAISFGQDQTLYTTLVAEAYELYAAKDYLKSAEKYSEAFVALGNKGYVNDRYNAACAWALAGNADSSFTQLFKIATKAAYSNLHHITSDSDLVSLHRDARWTELTGIILDNKNKEEAHLDKALVAILDTVYNDDQTYRVQMDEIRQTYGDDSDEWKNLVKTIHEKDSINLKKVTKILDERGWLGADIIGTRGNSALFLVIQHADIETQEKYLPMMREAVAAGNARASSLALLEDRVALRNGGKQIYGSQVRRDPESGEYSVLPLIDPENVDKRRAEVGLGPIAEYLANWGIVWDAENYK